MMCQQNYQNTPCDEWYWFPIGWGFCGTNIQPGHVHMFVQTDMNLSKQETDLGLKQSLCMLVKSINQVIDRIERMFECKGRWCCELQMLQNRLITFSGHVSMQTKWGTTKYVWHVIRLKHLSWHSLCCCKEKKNRHEPQKLTPCKRVRKGFVCGLENGCFEVLQRQQVKKETQHGVHWRISTYLGMLDIPDTSHPSSI